MENEPAERQLMISPVTSVIPAFVEDRTLGVSDDDLRWCIEPIAGQLDADQRLFLVAGLRQAVKRHLVPVLLEERYGDRKTSTKHLSAILKHATMLAVHLNELHPLVGKLLTEAAPKDVDESALDLANLHKILPRLRDAAALSIPVTERSRGGQGKVRLRLTVLFVMIPIERVTGQWVKGALKVNGLPDPHLKGEIGKVVIRFFSKVDRHVTLGELVSAVRAMGKNLDVVDR